MLSRGNIRPSAKWINGRKAGSLANHACRLEESVVMWSLSRVEALSMKANLKLLLQETWNPNGDPICVHPDISLDRSYAGVLTGFHICTVCGQVLRISSMRKSSVNSVHIRAS